MRRGCQHVWLKIILLYKSDLLLISRKPRFHVRRQRVWQECTLVGVTENGWNAVIACRNYISLIVTDIEQVVRLVIALCISRG